MTNPNWMTSLAWFITIIAFIPLVLWLLKRTPMGAAASKGLMRNVATLPLSPTQRVVTVEVGQGEDRRWLVLGVTAHSITTLHTMAPQPEGPGLATSTIGATPFAQTLSGALGRWQQKGKPPP
jgi:flagellar protein FliO/FliZ